MPQSRLGPTCSSDDRPTFTVRNTGKEEARSLFFFWTLCRVTLLVPLKGTPVSCSSRKPFTGAAISAGGVVDFAASCDGVGSRGGTLLEVAAVAFCVEAAPCSSITGFVPVPGSSVALALCVFVSLPNLEAVAVGSALLDGARSFGLG